ncbi:MAG: T9SS type A sorting domain-containing protein [Ignavibacteriae bacterium]|nr:T9SS type A sorting domain-containing protein [Ignavibacteriota bacterium]
MFRNLFILLIIIFSTVNLLISKENSKVDSYLKTEQSGFWENKGQILDNTGKQRNDILFYHSSPNMKIYLKNDGICYEYRKIEKKEIVKNNLQSIANNEFDVRNLKSKTIIKTHTVDIQLLASNPKPEIIKEGISEDYNNYYGGNFGENGLLFVHNYQKIIYKNVYPNIDLVYYVNDDNQENSFSVTNNGITKTYKDIKYDFIVKPGGNISSIKIKYTGAENVSISPKGSLLIKTSLGTIEEATPYSFTNNLKETESPLSNINNKIVDVKYKLEDNILTFSDADYDKSGNLIIDPRLIWGTYYGGEFIDEAIAVAVDKVNNIVVTGYTTSNFKLATTGAYNITGDSLGGQAFILKLDSTGKRKWCTYYGTLRSDTILDIGTGIDCFTSDKSIVVAGITYSDDSIATPGAYQTVRGGESDVFLARFDSNGVRKWATYFGGDSAEGDISRGVNLCINAKGDILMTGWTKSPTGIATPGAYKSVLNNNMDAFIVRFDSSGNREWGTYYGIDGVLDYGSAIATDQRCNIFVTGKTNSMAGLATPGTHQFSSCDGFDAFVTKFDSNGTIVWGTYYGGCSPDEGFDIYPDGWGNVILTGFTSSVTDISTPNSMQPIYAGGGGDAFMAKLDTNGRRLWGTYYGGSGYDIGLGLTQDKYRNIVLTGITNSADNITTICTQKAAPGEGLNQFLSKFGPDGSIQWGTYYCAYTNGLNLGGSDIDIDKNGDIIIVGGTKDTFNVATPGAHDVELDTTRHESPLGPYWVVFDGFIAKFGPVIPPSEFESKDDEPQYASVCLTAGPVIGPYCVGQEIVVPFKTYVTFNSGNVFTAKLSNKYGEFVTPTIIGTVTATSSDTIRGIIPVGIPFGRSYRVMVSASNPQTVGEPNPYEITIGPCFAVDSIYGPFCQGETIDVTFGAFLDYNNNNVFTAQLSDYKGDFSSPIDIGTINATASNTITAVLPRDATPGSGYRIRVVASSPQLISEDNGTNFTINPLPQPDFIGPDELCFGNMNLYQAIDSSEGFDYEWYVENGNIIGSSNRSSVTVQWKNAADTKLKLIQTYTATGCTDSITKLVNVANIILPDSIGESPTCDKIELNYKAPQNEYLVDHTWIVTGGTIVSGETDSIVTVRWDNPGTGKIKLIISFRDDPDCKDSVEQTFTVKESPFVTLDTFPSVCTDHNSFYLKQGKPDGGTYSGPGVFELGLFYPNVAGEGSHTITYSYTGNNGCTISKTGILRVNPLPAKPTITKVDRTLISSSDYGNQWYLNGNIIADSVKKTYSPMQNGTYSVQVTDSLGCKSEISDGFPYFLSVGDGMKSGYFRIYPNPAQDKLMIEINTDLFPNIDYKLINLLGESLIKSTIVISNSKTTESINLKNLKNGIYFIELKLGQSIYNEKIIINK